MSVISRLILLHPDVRLAESLRFGFEREGVTVTNVSSDGEVDPAAFEGGAELVIAGGRDSDEARAMLSRVRGALAWLGQPLPVLYVGNGISRAEAIEEGASEYLGQPAYVRDAVT